MLFNSLLFAFFFILVYILYRFLNHKWQNKILLAASYVFYGAWDWRFLSLIIISTVLDYFCGLKIHGAINEKKRKFFVSLSIIGNLSILGFFKYFDFFAANLKNLLDCFGFSVQPHFLNIILPIGISFYTFQTMSYSLDIYRRKMAPTKDFLDFALFVAFFPQLVAGPIERAKNLLPQISRPRTITYDNYITGGWLILRGYFKKIVIADSLAIIVNDVYQTPAAVPCLLCLLATYAFAFQIYCDFSGYSDIARGLAKLMGIDIMQNFNQPDLARNPREFWQRWHISLSTWLRDYLYIPLGGNHHGRFNTYRNLMIAMLLGGLWHGAAWTFVVWGFYQGILLIIHRYVFFDHIIKVKKNVFTDIASRILMFHLVCLGWMIFRANSLGQFLLFIRQIFFDFSINIGMAQMEHYYLLFFYLLLFAGTLIFLEALVKNWDNPGKFLRGWNAWIGPVIAAIMVLAIITMQPEGRIAFIYFQF